MFFLPFKPWSNFVFLTIDSRFEYPTHNQINLLFNARCLEKFCQTNTYQNRIWHFKTWFGEKIWDKRYIIYFSVLKTCFNIIFTNFKYFFKTIIFVLNQTWHKTMNMYFRIRFGAKNLLNTHLRSRKKIHDEKCHSNVISLSIK